MTTREILQVGHPLLRQRSAEVNQLQLASPEVQQLIDDLIDTPATANHAFTPMRTFFNWAVARRYLKHSTPFQKSRDLVRFRSAQARKRDVRYERPAVCFEPCRAGAT